ncbi:MAG: SRPBCC family protein [Candidatus Eiseniibacteriota bacterium]
MDDPGVVSAPGALRIERLLPGPIERVWAYITEPEKRRLWLAGGTMELKAGGKANLFFRHAELSPVKEETPERYKAKVNGQTVTGTILRCEPPHLLTLTWEYGPATEVTFELTKKGDDVLLVVTHRRLSDRDMLIGVGSGWHTHLGILADRLAGRPPRPFWATHEALIGDYRKRLADAPLADGGGA